MLTNCTQTWNAGTVERSNAGLLKHGTVVKILTIGTRGVGLALNPLKNIVTAPCYKSLDFWYSISIYLLADSL